MRVLKKYIKYYNQARPHQGIGQRFPVSAPQRRTKGKIRRRNVLGGIIHDLYIPTTFNPDGRERMTFLHDTGMIYASEDGPNLKVDAARSIFITLFKDVQHINTQLDQYTDLTTESTDTIEQVQPQEQLQAFRGVYLETAQCLKTQQDKGDEIPEVQQLDFELVLFASSIIDYNFIKALIARYTQEKPGKENMSREQLIGLILSDAKFIDEHDEITAYINTLKVRQGLSRYNYFGYMK